MILMHCKELYVKTPTEAARARLLLETIREDLPSPQRRLTDRFTHEETKLWSFQTEIMV